MIIQARNEAMKECENIIDIQKYKDFENTATLDVVLLKFGINMSTHEQQNLGGESCKICHNEAMIALGR